MSVLSLVNVNTVHYYPPDGQDKETGGETFGDLQIIKGRFGSGSTRFDTQEATDQVSDASFSSMVILKPRGKLLFREKGYIIAQAHEIVNGNGDLSHYNYLLKTLNNSDL